MAGALETKHQTHQLEVTAVPWRSLRGLIVEYGPSEAAQVVVEFGFQTLRYALPPTIHPGNSGSISIARQKLGMQFEWTQRESRLGMDGEFVDVYAVLGSDPHPWGET